MPAIRDFAEALMLPESRMPMLVQRINGGCAADGFEVECDITGAPALTRVTNFVEAVVRWNSGFWILAMPLRDEALQRVGAVTGISGTAIAEHRLLEGAMSWQDNMGRVKRTTLVAQRLPAGSSFEEALRCEPRERLLAALDRLESGLRAMKLSHNNLKAQNLRWSEGRFMVLRCYDAESGTEDFERDRRAFEELRRQISLQAQSTDNEWSDTPPAEDLSGCFEDRRRVIVEGMTGFEDAAANVVIEPRYEWCEDFREGRAVVATKAGYGVIDRDGNYIIRPEYEMIEYDSERSLFFIRRRGRWATFDYMGRPLTKFTAQTNPEFANK